MTNEVQYMHGREADNNARSPRLEFWSWLQFFKDDYPLLGAARLEMDAGQLRLET